MRNKAPQLPKRMSKQRLEKNQNPKRQTHAPEKEHNFLKHY